jgi:hypothetical protein
MDLTALEDRFLVSGRRPNHAMERTATRRGLTFSISKSLPSQAALALSGRRSSCSR